MCWVGNSNQLMIASKNIPVFKILYKASGTDKVFSSVYQQYLYTLGKKYTSQVIIEDNINSHYGYDSYLCNTAIHSYSPKVAIKASGLLIRLIGSHDGFLDCFLSYSIPNLVKIEGIIPKGSLYQVNMNGEYISNQIILTRIGKLFR